MEGFDGRGARAVPVLEVAVEGLKEILGSSGTQQLFENFNCCELICDLASRWQRKTAGDNRLQNLALPPGTFGITICNEGKAVKLSQECPVIADVVDDRRDEDEVEEPVVPKAVEHVAGREHPAVLSAVAETPIRREDREEENPEGKARVHRAGREPRLSVRPGMGRDKIAFVPLAALVNEKLVEVPSVSLVP